MIRIGFTRWFPYAFRSQERGGTLVFDIGLTPQANNFRIIRKEWQGLHSNIVEATIQTKEINKQFTADVSDSIRRIIEQSNRLAKEVASDAVTFCSNQSLVNFENLERTASLFLVETAVNRQIQVGGQEAFDYVDMIDVVDEMKAAEAERIRIREEQAAAQAAQYAIHRAEEQERNALRLKAAEGACKVSLQLLYSILTPSERDEADSKGQVTIKTLSGIFVIPVQTHALIKHYSDEGLYLRSYCIVFKDYSIPVGDEALMKVALVRADPKKLLEVANKFPEPWAPKRINPVF